MVTLTMVPDRFENHATAHLMAFKQRKQMMAGGKPISADSGTLTCIIHSKPKLDIHNKLYPNKLNAGGIFRFRRWR